MDDRSDAERDAVWAVGWSPWQRRWRHQSVADAEVEARVAGELDILCYKTTKTMHRWVLCTVQFWPVKKKLKTDFFFVVYNRTSRWRHALLWRQIGDWITSGRCILLGIRQCFPLQALVSLLHVTLCYVTTSYEDWAWGAKTLSCLLKIFIYHKR